MHQHKRHALKAINTLIPVHLFFFVLAFSAIILVHAWHIGSMPRDLYVDETSIGYNAALIAQTAHDEHGEFLPVYFRAFGEYKNPLYIYATAVLFFLFGVSDTILRLTSTFFFALFLGGLCMLIRRLTTRKEVLWYALISGGFLPWFFTLSRISFEVISQITCVIFALFFIHRTFHPLRGEKSRILYPLLAGFCIALSLYSYSTGRLLSFLLFTSVAVLYFRRSTLRQSLALSGAFFFSMIPYFTYAFAHPGALSNRFRSLSFVYDAELSLIAKISKFAGQYLTYFDPRFLLLSGDSNLRHATGYGGELFVAVSVLAIIGLLAWPRMKKIPPTFAVLLLVNLLFSPIGGALTKNAHHSLRSILLGFYILLFSCIGFAILVELRRSLPRIALLSLVCLTLSGESGLYVYDYFTRYPQKTQAAFEVYGARAALASALSQVNDPIFSNRLNHTLPGFYLSAFRGKTKRIVTQTISRDTAQPGTCIVYRRDDQKELEAVDLPVFEISIPDSAIRTRCYPTLSANGALHASIISE